MMVVRPRHVPSRADRAMNAIGAVCAIFASATHVPAQAAAGNATANRAPYTNIEFLLDNSASMEIGATAGDIAALMYLTPCSEPAMPMSGQAYEVYQCKVEGIAYGGDTRPFNAPSCPVKAARGVLDTKVMTPGLEGPRCGATAEQTGGLGKTFASGAPCAFACHWAKMDHNGPPQDYFALARRTIGQAPCLQRGTPPGACAITLRFDLVKNAVIRAINTMHDSNDARASHFSAGVFTFNTDLHAIYPLPAKCGLRGSPACEAGEDWPAILGSVGAPPSTGDNDDSGIQPFGSENMADTNLPKALTALAHQYLTPAGTGRTPQSPRKDLVLVTDGVDDHIDSTGRHFGAVDPSLCQIYKTMGYTVFVLYTPYYPQMNAFYLYNIKSFAEGAGPGSLSYNLRQCASDPSRDFIEANPGDVAAISNGLQIFLRRTQDEEFGENYRRAR